MLFYFILYVVDNVVIEAKSNSEENSYYKYIQLTLVTDLEVRAMVKLLLLIEARRNQVKQNNYYIIYR